MSKPKFNELLKDELINRLYMIKQAIAKLQTNDDDRSLIGQTFTNSTLNKFADMVDVLQSF